MLQAFKAEEDPDKKKDLEGKIDTQKIEALSDMLRDFQEIINKNYNQYKNYNDFSFIQARSADHLKEVFQEFSGMFFQGDFQLKDWFQGLSIPKVFYLKEDSKFIESLKILTANTECNSIKN